MSDSVKLALSPIEEVITGAVRDNEDHFLLDDLAYISFSHCSSSGRLSCRSATPSQITLTSLNSSRKAASGSSSHGIGRSRGHSQPCAGAAILQSPHSQTTLCWHQHASAEARALIFQGWFAATQPYKLHTSLDLENTAVHRLTSSAKPLFRLKQYVEEGSAALFVWGLFR